MVRLSPVSMTIFMPSACKQVNRFRRARFDRIGHAQQSGRLAVDRRRTSPFARRAAAIRRDRADRFGKSIFSSSNSLALPSATSRPSILPTTPLPVIDRKSSTLGKFDLLFFRGGDDRCGQRMFAGAFQCGGETQKSSFIVAQIPRRELEC